MAQQDEDEIPLLNDWRQGDLALLPVDLPFLDVIDDKVEVSAGEAVAGVVLLTQSCDIIRSIDQKPYVHVAALLKVDAAELERARRGHLPGRIFLQCLEAQSLVVDLDSSATVHKEVVALWPRTGGCADDDERRRFAAGLARHRQRFAFPDQFNEMVKPIRRWFERKAGKDSSAGRLVDNTREVRVLVDDWEQPNSIVFLAILEKVSAEERKAWQEELDSLANKAVVTGYPEPEFRIATLHEISAAELLASDRLDWDGLSDA